MEQSGIGFLMSPVAQYGFAGMCVILMVFVFWLVRKVFQVLAEVTSVIQANTNAITELTKLSGHDHDLLRSVHDKLLERPCLVKEID
jgi:uncharacterized BrkB/YihY/UPF0761 family membrane protein